MADTADELEAAGSPSTSFSDVSCVPPKQLDRVGCTPATEPPSLKSSSVNVSESVCCSFHLPGAQPSRTGHTLNCSTLRVHSSPTRFFAPTVTPSHGMGAEIRHAGLGRQNNLPGALDSVFSPPSPVQRGVGDLSFLSSKYLCATAGVCQFLMERYCFHRSEGSVELGSVFSLLPGPRDEAHSRLEGPEQMCS